jgi:hypothetical protein
MMCRTTETRYVVVAGRSLSTHPVVADTCGWILPEKLSIL